MPGDNIQQTQVNQQLIEDRKATVDQVVQLQGLKHSELFNQYSNGSRLRSTNIVSDNLSYENLNALLFELYDNHFGIITVVNDRDKNSHTTRSISRNATYALSLEDRPSPNDPLIESVNLLQRTLGTTRAIDHVVQTKEQKNQLKQLYNNLLSEVARWQNELAELNRAENVTKVIIKRKEAIQRKLIKLEREYNTNLCLLLKKFGLAPDLKTALDYQKILIHYRYLASVLDPAPTVTTLNYDHLNNIYLVETDYPITDKTTDQLYRLRNDFEKIDPTNPSALQIANTAFTAKIVNPLTSLPAQFRKITPATIKNGFFVFNKVVNLQDPSNPKVAIHIGGRMAAIAYVGKGVSKAEIKSHIEMNLDQARSNYSGILTMLNKQGLIKDEELRKKKFEIVLLMTNSKHEQQSVVIQNTKEVVRNHADKDKTILLNLPLNFEGVMYSGDVMRPENNHAGETIFSRLSSNLRPTFDRSDRMAQIVNVIKDSDTIQIVMCMSGQDRTGVTYEAMIMEWLKKAYNVVSSLHPRTFFQDIRARGGIAAFLSSVLVPGSPGIKPESRPGNYFSNLVNKVFFRKSANTNKTSPVDKRRLTQSLSELYADENGNSFHMHQRGRELISSIDQYIKSELQGTHSTGFKKDLEYLKQMLYRELKDGSFSTEDVKTVLNMWNAMARLDDQGIRSIDDNAGFFLAHPKHAAFIDNLTQAISKEVLAESFAEQNKKQVMHQRGQEIISYINDFIKTDLKQPSFLNRRFVADPSAFRKDLESLKELLQEVLNDGKYAPKKMLDTLEAWEKLARLDDKNPKLNSTVPSEHYFESHPQHKAFVDELKKIIKTDLSYMLNLDAGNETPAEVISHTRSRHNKS